MKREDIPHAKAQRHESIQHTQETKTFMARVLGNIVSYEAGEIMWG